MQSPPQILKLRSHHPCRIIIEDSIFYIDDNSTLTKETAENIHKIVALNRNRFGYRITIAANILICFDSEEKVTLNLTNNSYTVEKVD